MTATVRLYGSGNRIELPKTSSFVGHITVRGRGNRILIGENCRIAGELLIKGSNQTISIGEGTTFESVYIVCLERCDVTIGRWCMFSRGIEVRTSDAHSLIRKRDGQRLNVAASVAIGDHVWVGVGALISKGAVIPDDCVVGAKSFVNKAFSETGILLAGTPATIVKRDITWNRSRKRLFSKDEMEEWRGVEPDREN
ncbi:acyltransferase [Rhizobium herbae]